MRSTTAAEYWFLPGSVCEGTLSDVAWLGLCLTSNYVRFLKEVIML